MAVLVEGISVVIKKSAIVQKHPQRLSGFIESAPNRTFCEDDELVRIGFMAPNDAQDFVEHLAVFGLIYVDGGRPIDMIVVDQCVGFVRPCDWAKFVRIEVGPGQTVAACMMTGRPSPDVRLGVPLGWHFENSLSATSKFVRSEDMKQMESLGREDNLEVFRDRSTGKKYYIGTTTPIEKQDESKQIGLIMQRALDLEQIGGQARAQNNRKSAEAVYKELMSDLLVKIQTITVTTKFHSGFAHFTYGLVLRIAGLGQQAEAEFRKSLSFNPDAYNTLLELTRCLGEQGRFSEAMEPAERAVKVEPKSAAAWGNLAMTLTRQRYLGSSFECGHADG